MGDFTIREEACPARHHALSSVESTWQRAVASHICHSSWAVAHSIDVLKPCLTALYPCRRRSALSLIGLTCLCAMGLGFYRGWSDTSTAPSDSEAEVQRWFLACHACEELHKQGVE